MRYTLSFAGVLNGGDAAFVEGNRRGIRNLLKRKSQANIGSDLSADLAQGGIHGRERSGRGMAQIDGEIDFARE